MYEKCSHGKKFDGEQCIHCEFISARESIIYLRTQTDRLSEWIAKIEKEVLKNEQR